MHDDDVEAMHGVVGLQRGRLPERQCTQGSVAPAVGCVLTDTALPAHVGGLMCRAALQ
jgi:hypothetical protein